MTLTRRMALLIAGVLLLALGGALVIHTLGARQALLQQQDMRNRDAAATLALALSQLKGDAVALQTAAAAQFDQGHYRRIRLTAPDGRVLIDLQQADPAPGAPAWFLSLLPLQVPPGSALVSAGWVELGTLRVEAHTTWAQQVLWRATTQTAGLLAALAAAAALLAAVLLRAWYKPLADTVAQAQALEQGRFVQAPLPDLPELRQLTRAMNTTVQRLRETFAHQAEQVAYLRRRAQLDALTGLPLRAHFAQALARRLDPHDAGGLALVLVRVSGLADLNREQGHDAADALLRSVAAELRAAWQAQPDVLAGRLGGSDFALCLPLPGMAAEMGPLLLQRLHAAARQALPEADLSALLHLVALEDLRGDDAEAVLSQCAQALVQAEGGHDVQALQAQRSATAAADLAAWGQRLEAALNGERAQLGEYEVQDAHGGLIHLECPLRLQLDADGDFQPAARWLAVARRCQRLPQVDGVAVRLALQACQRDGRPRAVNVSLESFADATWTAAVSQGLQASPAAARLLSIECVDALGRGEWDAAAQVIAAWQKLGVRVGVEHAGAAPEQLARLRDLGLQYVKVDGLHLRGAATDTAVAAYARSLVGLIQLLGLQALAEGVDRPDDLAALWQLGFDGATGRAVREGGG